jgi:outer membrane immunogenic protein
MPGIGAASAADLPLKAPPPVVAPVWSWTGFYIGANGGYGWGLPNTVNLTNPPVTAFGVEAPGRAAGGFGGIQAGYNWQFGSFVFGGEADVQGASIKRSIQTVNIDAGGDAALSSQNLDTFYTVRARAGWAFDRALVYFTGGWAGGHIADSILVTNSHNAAESATLTDSTSRSGFAVGFGLEYAFDPHWSVKGEYQYIDLGSGTPVGPVVGGPAGTVSATSVRDAFNTVRIGINFRWDNPAVVARY